MGQRSVGERLVSFLIYMLLTVVTLGLYGLYFWVTRTEERNALLDQILTELRQRPAER